MRRVVITGMGAVTPIGNNVDEFWNGLVTGKNGIAEITHFDTTDFAVKLAAEVKNFDPLPYMAKSEVRKTDLFVRYALSAAAQAVEESNIIDNIDCEKLGVYFGSGIGGFATFTDEYDNLINRGAKRVSPLFIPKMISNIGAGNIAIKYGAKGPCLSVTTACATGTSCIGEAYRAIKHGYADAIIAGGSEASVTPLAVAGFTNCMALTESNDAECASIPFDKRRNGFVMGEGAGAIVLEEYEHAVKRNAKIYAEVCGYGSTCDAYHVTAPDPTGMGGARAVKAAYDEMCENVVVTPDKLYINAHGTSTPLNDKTETAAIKAAFGDGAYDISISSTKSMTGHMLGAAGAVEIIASALAVKNGIVPPTIGYVESDPECDLNYTPNKCVNKELDAAMSISLGFGGHNACVAVKAVK